MGERILISYLVRKNEVVPESRRLTFVLGKFDQIKEEEANKDQLPSVSELEGANTALHSQYKNPLIYFLCKSSVGDKVKKSEMGDRPVRSGDHVAMANYNNYKIKHPTGDWEGINLITAGKNEAGEDLFLGFGLNSSGVREREILEKFVDAHNKASRSEKVLEKDAELMEFRDQLKYTTAQFRTEMLNQSIPGLNLKDKITAKDLPEYIPISIRFNDGRVAELLTLSPEVVASHLESALASQNRSTQESFHVRSLEVNNETLKESVCVKLF